MTDQSWCLSGELPLATAQKLETLIELIADEIGEFPPTLSYFEQAGKNDWRIEIYFPTEPDYSFITKMLAAGNLLDWDHEIAPIEEKDWVSESQKLLQPVEAGRFFVFGSHDADQAKEGSINLQIDAGQAFGTGKHETTAGCLSAIDGIAHTDFTPETVLDLGTGSGVLALAAHKVWSDARVIASDIDPIAIDVCRDNIVINKGDERPADSNLPGIGLVVADGLEDPVFKHDAPFDLITANILAGPLVDMAGDITDNLKAGGKLILSGLLATQEKEVLDAYLTRGLVSQGKIENGEWLALSLTKP
ncbi:50S ribosomal protein L11 methyltransferase [Kordiimonas laminariae]|uniref:50S ribosomal protein L11 methyltransferase n=1 Tax=Kordiimonas laminariae TaxID=2917717 RepID=UPI001FF179E0|nr:50S ribosomal protein L11 methyltransferase [Kordiimonas laminariae]MCK0068544.1 50S ribosomal protein L11 methyltransferase [Kordiimonas laminariae]